MENSNRLYKEAEKLCKEIKTANFSWSEQDKRFEKLLNEFFKNPTQVYGSSSAIIFKKLNEVFENYIKSSGNDDISYNFFVLQCRIDCFFARLIELYDLNTINEILGTTTKIRISDEIEELLYKAWEKVDAIAMEVANYLANSNVKYDDVTEMTIGVDKKVKSKFIDHPEIQEHEGLWIRVFIMIYENKETLVKMAIVPQDEGGAAITYDITSFCKKLIKTLA